MAVCLNCNTTIDDMRRETRCSACGAPLHRTCAIKENNKYFCDTCYTVKNQEKNKIDIKIPEVIRRSYIETYMQCPYKFYMEVIKGIAAPPNIYTQIGIDIHKLVEKLCHNPGYTKKEMITDFLAYWKNYDELFEQEEQKETMYQRAMSSIDNAYQIIPEMKNPLATEDKIITDIEGSNIPKISTTIDRIDASGDKLTVCDWKTGVVMVGQAIANNLQAPLYIYAVQQKYNKIVKYFTFHYLKDNKMRIFKRISPDNYICIVGKRNYYINIVDTIKKVKSIFSNILNGNFNVPHNPRSMFFICKTCHIRKLGFCQTAEVESWKQKKQRSFI